MSLVERALQKLQASRTAAQSAAPPVLQQPVVRSMQTMAAVEPVQPVRAIPPRPVVKIDRDALRARDLLPPSELERQIAGQYQQIKRPLVAAAAGRSPTQIANAHLIMIASALPGEGKTFTSINLALSMAMEKDTEVVLVDADIPKPHVSRLLGLQAATGLIDLLVDSSLHAESVILPTDVPGLSVLPAGTRHEAATELLASARMETVVAELGSSGGGRRIVLFDSPPLLLSTESRALAHAVGQVVLVVRAEFTARHAVQDAIDAIGETKPISLILNQAEAPPSTGYYGYGSYGDTATSQPASEKG